MKLAIIIGILVFNSCVAIGYLLYGFIHCRRVNLAIDHDKAPNDTNEKQPIRFTKYVLFAFIIFFCPLVGMSLLIFGHFFYTVFFDNNIDLASVTFSKERVKVLDVPDEENEINIVPIEEAIMIDDKENLRRLLLNVLRGDMSKSINAVTKALNSSDTETSHYAASAIMDIMAEFQKTIIKFQAQLENNQDDYELNRLYIEYLCNMLNTNIFSEMELRNYIYTLQNVCQNMYEHNRSKMLSTHYSCIIDLLTRIGAIEDARKWVHRIYEDHKSDAEMYRCVLRFEFETKNKTDFFRILEELKHSDVTIDRNLLELIRLYS